LYGPKFSLAPVLGLVPMLSAATQIGQASRITVAARHARSPRCQTRCAGRIHANARFQRMVSAGIVSLGPRSRVSRRAWESAAERAEETPGIADLQRRRLIQNV